jgi:tetratricopeptide (TPR) repeat protein
LAESQFEQGYQLVREASELSQDIPELLRQAAPNLVVGARNVLSTNPTLAEAMADLALTLDDALRLPKDMRGKIAEARKAEDTVDCLKAIQAQHKATDLEGALATADQLLAKYPGVKQVESVRARILVEIDQQRKQRARTDALDQFREMELSAATMGPTELLQVKRDVHQIAGLNPGDEEVNQRASTLDSLFSSLAEVRGFLHAHALTQAEEAGNRALEKFPAHPLFKAALAEAARQKAELAAQYKEQVKQRLDTEVDFTKQAAILHDALSRHPQEPYFLEQQAALNELQESLNARIERARVFESKRLFGESIKEWESLSKDYPWYSGVGDEVERISIARRREKQEALDRWFGQVEDAIQNGDYDSASAMLRQAAQQQPDRKLQGLEAKLKEGLKKKQESDAKLTQGSSLLADGDLVEGGKALYRAFELQPKDREKANSIVLLLLGQVRANMATDLASCESLLTHLNRIRPEQVLPPDIRDAIGNGRQASDANRSGTRKMMEELAHLTMQAENAPSKRTLATLAKKLQDSKILDSRDLEVRRAAGELLRKINLSLSGMETALVKAEPPEPLAPPRRVSLGVIIAAALFLIALASVVFFLSRPAGVPVQISVTPEHTVIELDGKTCIAPDCAFTLKPGEHAVSLRKPGFKEKTLTVTVNPGDSTPVNLTAELEPLTMLPVSAVTPADSDAKTIRPSDAEAIRAALAKIEIHGARPGTRVKLDGSDIGMVSDDGGFRVDVPPGSHILDLSLDGFSDRTIKREFNRGETVSLASDAVQLQPRQRNISR